MLIRRHDYCTGVPQTGHNNRPLWNMQFYPTAQCHRCCKFWGSMRLACWLQECPPELFACELNVHFSTISHLQRRFRQFSSASNRPHNRRPRVTTLAQVLHIQHVHLQDRLRPATRTAAATLALHNQRISAQTVRNHLREAHLHAHRTHRGLNLTAVRRLNQLEWGNRVAHGGDGVTVMDKEHRCILLMAFWWPIVVPSPHVVAW